MAKASKIEGKPVVDAKRKVILRILPADIECAKTKAPDACAAAMACVRQLHAMSARVHLTRTYLEYFDEWVRYITPGSLRTEIAAFDKGGRFAPGAHALSAPAGFLADGARKDYDKERNVKRQKAKKAAGPTNKRKLPPTKTVDVRDIAKYR